LDVLSYGNALREAMREAPRVIMIGEVRDRRAMEAAVAYADTGYLCLTTLHAVNASQPLDRVLNFSRPTLSTDLNGSIAESARYHLATAGNGPKRQARACCRRIDQYTVYQRTHQNGKFGEMKETMEKGWVTGMRTF
jgi:twitching motility protein PilU